jgi:hypothetical protein
LAPRFEVIAGTVALLDINKARGDVLIDQVKRGLTKILPGREIQALLEGRSGQARVQRYTARDSGGLRLRY